MRKTASSLSVYLYKEYVFRALSTLALVFLGGKLGHYIFFNLDSSPALIWPPVGLSLLAVYLWGNRMWIPILVAHVVLSLTSPGDPSLLVIATVGVGYTLQALIGAYALRYFGFVGSMAGTREVLVFLGVTFLVPAFAPLVTTAAQVFASTLTLAAWTNFSRAWAGGVLSILVLVPLVTPWRLPFSGPFLRREQIETFLGISSVFIATYVVFWTTLPRANIFLVLLGLFGVLGWVSLRMRPRFTTLSIFIVAAFGIAGSIIARPFAPTSTLSQQLFANELFVILIAPIFLILAAVVTERVRALTQYQRRTQELEEALKQLSAEDKAKTEFIATLAHELRNPLAPIVSTLELLKKQDPTESTQALLASALQQGRHMGRLLDDLLDVARITKRGFNLKKEVINLSGVTSQALASAQSYLEQRGHELMVSMPETPVWLEADPVRLEQILINLLNNAGKYTDPGGRLELRGRPEGDTFIIEVVDNGIGIAPERIGNIFEAFGGAEGNSRRPGGLRLGLSLAKYMAELHGGNLAVSSAGEGKGSMFTLELPLPTQPRTPHTTEKSVEKTLFSKGVRILVVDDNEAAAQGIGKLLEHYGHEVVLAYDGASALEAFERFAPTLVLLDIGLPDMDGYEVGRRIRAQEPEVLLVALSGYGQEEDKARSRNAGFNSHLTKPISIDLLQKVIGSLLGSR